MMKKNLWKVLAAILCVACMLPVFTACSFGSIDLNKYVVIESSGYDTMGSVTVRFDKEAFLKDYEEDIQFNGKNSTEKTMAALWYGSAAAMLLDECVELDYKYADLENVRNGDTVTVGWNCKDEKAKEYFDVTLKHSDITYTVSGLKETGTFDPFQYATIAFEGISPNGKVNISQDYARDEMQYVNFECDSWSGLANGDEVTVTASIQYGQTDAFVEQFGSVLSPATKTVTVSGLSSYLTEIGQLDEAERERLDSQFQDAFRAHAASSWTNKNKNALKELKLLGAYVLSEKPGLSAIDFHNSVFFLYRVTCDFYANQDENPTTVEYYWYGTVDDLIVGADGKCQSDLSQYRVCESSKSWGWASGDYLEFEELNGLYVAGFQTVNDFENEYIIPNIERHTYKYTEF